MELPGGFSLGRLDGDLPIACDCWGYQGWSRRSSAGENDWVADGGCPEGACQSSMGKGGIEGAGEVVEGDEEMGSGKGGRRGSGVFRAVKQGRTEGVGGVGEIEGERHLLAVDGSSSRPDAYERGWRY